MKFDEHGLCQRLGEDVIHLVLSVTILEVNNLFLDQLLYIILMDLNMLDLGMVHRIVSNLNSTSVTTWSKTH